MIEVVSISLENEMDLILAHKRSMKIAERVGLTIATQTTFATAVSEISRTVIEHTDSGVLKLGLDQAGQRYALKALLIFDPYVTFTNADEGIYYAQKLVPEFNTGEANGSKFIEIKLGIPRSLRIDKIKINLLKDYFIHEAPINAYEEIKKRNINLGKIADEREEEIRQSKMIDEKKNEFISIASHEIKTPITIIKAYTQIVKSIKDGYSPKVGEMLDKIDDQTAKLLSLVQQLLDVSKIENGNLIYSMEQIHFNPFVLDMISVMKQIIPDNEIQINMVDNQDLMVKIDRLRMEQVFSNLLSNAAKYSGKNTLININCIVDNNAVVVSVSDKGIGMSEEDMQSVFEKFYRVKDVLQTHGGLGMGLYIASKIVSDHGGKIWVSSKQGEGSTFSFSIPLSLN